MSKYLDADGNEVEAFTADELKTHPEFVKLQNEFTEAQKKLEDSSGASDEQKKRLREERDAAKKTLEEYKTSTDQKFTDLENRLFSGIKAKALNTFSKGNKEVADKLDLKYQSLMKTGEYTNDEDGINRAMTDAFTLVNGTKPTPSIMNNITGSGARGDGAPGGENTKVEFSENAKTMGKMMGITEDDIKKFGDKIK